MFNDNHETSNEFLNARFSSGKYSTNALGNQDIKSIVKIHILLELDVYVYNCRKNFDLQTSSQNFIHRIINCQNLWNH